MIFSSRILYSIFFYILALILIFMYKPSFIFNDDDTLKNFGLNSNNTIYSFGTLTVVLAVATFYLFAVIDYIFYKNIVIL
jgi:hypothetical protein